MSSTIHITSGDCAGGVLAKSGIGGEVFVWHDILYDGPRKAGWPDDDILRARALFLERATGGGLKYELIYKTLSSQYGKLKTLKKDDALILWFDACLFDQAMLSHILACLRFLGIQKAELICVDAFPGIEPYNGLGQLSPEQMASVYGWRKPVNEEQFCFADRVDKAFAMQDENAFVELSKISDAPLPWISAAVMRWLQEKPDAVTGLGRLEILALDALRSGCRTPSEIFRHVSANDTPPQFWGDTTLWAKINALAERKPPLVRIEGPEKLLPQWEGISDLKLFKVWPI
ncbi:MAG: hypothetical protein WC637_12110 [Victivallales bacterium]|jgi:hypothetical protein